MITVFAFAVLIGTTALILCNLRMILRDIVEVSLSWIGAGQTSQQMIPNVAFVALWCLVFGLGFF